MALFPSLPTPARLGDLLSRFPDHAGPLLMHMEGIMHAGAPLTAAQCELIAAYVSGLNACTFCFGSHRVYAEALGVEPGLIEALLEDVETAPVAPELRPLLRYVAKLNSLPSRLVQADADAVFAAGWDEAALFHAIQVSAAFNLFNRLVEGAGVDFDYSGREDSLTETDRTADYAGFARRIGAEPH